MYFVCIRFLCSDQPRHTQSRQYLSSIVISVCLFVKHLRTLFEFCSVRRHHHNEAPSSLFIADVSYKYWLTAADVHSQVDIINSAFFVYLFWFYVQFIVLPTFGFYFMLPCIDGDERHVKYFVFHFWRFSKTKCNKQYIYYYRRCLVRIFLFWWIILFWRFLQSTFCFSVQTRNARIHKTQL